MRNVFWYVETSLPLWYLDIENKFRKWKSQVILLALPHKNAAFIKLDCLSLGGPVKDLKEGGARTNLKKTLDPGVPRDFIYLSALYLGTLT